MELSLISFNIRCRDDENGHSIAERAPRLFAATEPYDADLIGFQEYRPQWEEYIAKYYGGKYDIFNKYRSVEKPESAPILWKKDKFELLKTGYFWYSDTPEVESRGWDELYNCHRICEYVILKNKVDGQEFCFMNTHFGFGDKGQVASAKLLADYAKKISDLPTFITGDFNMGPMSLGYAEMIKHFSDVNACLDRVTDITYHGYEPEKHVNAHIDYCFINSDVAPLHYEIIKTTFGGKFPSDHYGLFMKLKI